MFVEINPDYNGRRGGLVIENLVGRGICRPFQIGFVEQAAFRV